MISLVTVMGALALVGGSVGYFTFPMGLSMGIKGMMNLAENGPIYSMYVKPPFPLQSSFHFFAIKNPREVLRGGKMSFELKGPYKFNTMLTRDKMTFSNQGEKLSYETGRKLVPNEAESANFDEKMWLLNPILPTIRKSVTTLVLDRVPFRSLSEPIVFNAVNLLLDAYKERLIVRATPRILLEGRKVEMLEAMMNLAGRFGLATYLPAGPPNNTFGLAFVQNETVEPLEVWTGLGSTRDKFAEVSKFRGLDRMDIWRGKCNSIVGTNGELYKPLLEEGKPIKIFLGLLCRSYTVDPASEGLVETSTGIKALEYELSPRMYLGARSNPANKCYCDNTRTYDCQYDGLVAMGPCFFNVPLFFSRANFKMVDPKIRDLIDWQSVVGDGKRLSEKQSFKIEPITGTVLEADVTVVALFKMVRQPYMRDIANVQNLTYVPLFATSETISLPYSAVWPVHMVQKLNDNHKLFMAGTALSGLGMLAMKFLFR